MKTITIIVYVIMLISLFNPSHAQNHLTPLAVLQTKESPSRFTLQLKSSLAGHKHQVSPVDFSPDGRGTASQLIEIPDLKKGTLAISALVLAEATPGGTQGLRPDASIEAALSPVQFPSNAAVRRFQPGASLYYAYQIHNVRLDRARRRPELTTQVTLFRDGEQVFAGPETKSEASQKLETTSLKDSGLLRLGQLAAAGQMRCKLLLRISRQVKSRASSRSGSISRS